MTDDGDQNQAAGY